MTGRTTGGVTRSYSYDAFDRMASVVEGQTTLQSMTYGPDSKRLSLTDSSGTRKFFYDRDDVIQEYDSDWSAVTKEYTHGPWVDEPLSMTDHTSQEANSTYYLMKDRLGSIINILDENETLKTTYSYDAFGQPTATYHSGQVDCTYRFTGREFDSGMGNYFYRARYYNQSLGRFFSRDPVMSLGSLYAYCNNSPENFTDPSGMEPRGMFDCDDAVDCHLCCQEDGRMCNQIANELAAFVGALSGLAVAAVAVIVWGLTRSKQAVIWATAGMSTCGAFVTTDFVMSKKEECASQERACAAKCDADKPAGTGSGSAMYVTFMLGHI